MSRGSATAVARGLLAGRPLAPRRRGTRVAPSRPHGLVRPRTRRQRLRGCPAPEPRSDHAPTLLLHLGGVLPPRGRAHLLQGVALRRPRGPGPGGGRLRLLRPPRRAARARARRAPRAPGAVARLPAPEHARRRRARERARLRVPVPRLDVLAPRRPRGGARDAALEGVRPPAVRARAAPRRDVGGLRVRELRPRRRTARAAAHGALEAARELPARRDAELPPARLRLHVELEAHGRELPRELPRPGAAQGHREPGPAGAERRHRGPRRAIRRRAPR